jgi:hypothetical protein
VTRPQTCELITSVTGPNDMKSAIVVVEHLDQVWVSCGKLIHIYNSQVPTSSALPSAFIVTTRFSQLIC